MTPQRSIDRRRLTELVESLAREYPPEIAQSELQNMPRYTFLLELVEPYRYDGAVLCDLGAGIGLFGVACQRLGWKTTVIDDFADPVNEKLGERGLALHRKYGVTVIACDVVKNMRDLGTSSVDVFTCFDSMEHWHRSPKRLFHELLRMLKPGGVFLLGVPNCVNLRKRLTVPLGRGKWTTMEAWYESERFRSHVREPDVDDLRYIARDLGLTGVRTLGRNWAGYVSPRAATRRLTTVIDHLLRPFPTLCSDIYLMGNKPG